MAWTATITSAFVRGEDDGKITSTSYLTVDQGIACAALTTPEAEATIMPDPEFTLAPGTNDWMQDFAWDPLKDEIFMTRNIRTSNGRETIRINRLGPADDQDVRHFTSSMTLTDAGHGDALGLQRKGNALSKLKSRDGPWAAPVIKIAKNATMLCTTNASHKKPRSRGGFASSRFTNQSQRLSWASNCPSL